MKDNFFVWATGGVIASVMFSPIVIGWIDDLLMSLGGVTRIDAFGEPTLSLILFTWFVFGLIWWVTTQFLVKQSFVLGLVVFCWTFILITVVLFPYPVSVLIWALFSFIMLN